MKKLLKESELIDLVENIVNEISNKTKSDYIKKSLNKNDSLSDDRVREIINAYLWKYDDDGNDIYFEFYDPLTNLMITTKPESSEFAIENGELVLLFFPDKHTKLPMMKADGSSVKQFKLTFSETRDYRPFMGNNQVEINREFAIILARTLNMIKGIEDGSTPHGQKIREKNLKIVDLFKKIFRFKKPFKPNDFKLLSRR